MSRFDNLGSPPPRIATSEELERRREAQERRASAPQPAPSGADAEAVRQHFESEDQQRVAEIEQKFAALHTKIDIDQAFSRLNGYARAHFQHRR